MFRSPRIVSIHVLPSSAAWYQVNLRLSDGTTSRLSIRHDFGRIRTIGSEIPLYEHQHIRIVDAILDHFEADIVRKNLRQWDDQA